MKKVTLVTFSSVSKAKEAGPAFRAWQIADLLHRHGKLKKIICLDYLNDGSLPDSLYLIPMGRTFNKIMFKMLGKFSKYLNIQDRRFKEEYFDFMVSQCKAVKESEVMLFLKPPFYKTVKKAKKYNITTFGQATVLHPKYNYKIVSDEYQKYKLEKQISSYTDKKRVENLSLFFDELDYIFLPSPNVKKYFLNEGIKEDKILYTPTINGGTPANKFSPKSNYNLDTTFRIVHVSHMNLIKGIGRLLEVWKKLNLKNAELILVGPMDENIRKIYERIQPLNVITPGSTDAPENFYKQADVMIQPSLSDASPFTILEAMACGVPVIASNACGNSDLIDNYINGIVFNINDNKEMKQAIDWFYNNRNKIEKMGEAARKAVDKCSVANFNEALLNGLSRRRGN